MSNISKKNHHYHPLPFLHRLKDRRVLHLNIFPRCHACRSWNMSTTQFYFSTSVRSSRATIQSRRDNTSFATTSHAVNSPSQLTTYTNQSSSAPCSVACNRSHEHGPHRSSDQLTSDHNDAWMCMRCWPWMCLLGLCG